MVGKVKWTRWGGVFTQRSEPGVFLRGILKIVFLLKKIRWIPCSGRVDRTKTTISLFNSPPNLLSHSDFADRIILPVTRASVVFGP